MEKIVLASNNMHKVKEFKEILTNFDILTLKEVGFYDEIIEDGSTFYENSLIKARTVAEFLSKNGLNYPVLADDSGLEVDSLGGAPGVYSARFSGIHGSDKANRNKLLTELQGKDDRKAHFSCVIVKYDPNGRHIYGEGKTFGEILEKEVGYDGFGYDCLFYSFDLNKSFGEATAEEKNRVSHRKRAIEDLLRKF